MWDVKPIGHGIGLRKEHFSHLYENPVTGVDWFEVISENYFADGGFPWAVLEKVRAQCPVVMHGVSMAIGNTDPINELHLNHLKKLAERLEPSWISDHICWGGYGGHNSHDLLPLPYTEETLNHIVPRIQYVQEALGRAMIFENVSSYVTFQESEMTEWEFVVELARRSGSGILLDVNNIYVSARNHGFSTQEYLEHIPVELVGQFHVAGHTDYGEYIIDTHIGPTPDAVWDVYREAVKRFGPIPTLIEWDEKIPEYEAVVAESTRARQIQQEVLYGTSSESGTSTETVLEVH